MTITRTMLRTRAIRAADAVGSQDWDTTSGVSGEVDQKLAVNYDREWIRCLDAEPSLRTGSRVSTSDSSGNYAISDFSSGSGDSRERFHRVLWVVRNGMAYRPGRLRQHPDPSTLTITNQREWYRDGSNVVLIPVEASAAATFKVNHLPPSITALSDDGVAITVPSETQEETFAEIVALETAADLLNKGGRETMEATGLRQLANDLRQMMLADLARTGEGPVVMQYDDRASDWAG